MNARTTYSFACAAFSGLVAVSSLAGCFSDRSSVVEPTAEELCTGAQPANVIRIQDFAFSPSQLSVARNTEVTFVNCGQQQHTATADNDQFDSGLIARFGTFKVTPAAAGSIPLHCEPHPSMKSTIVVQ